MLLALAAGGSCFYCTCTCVPGFPYQPLRLAVCHSARRLLFRWAWHVWINPPRQPTKIHTHTHTQRHARAADSRAPIKRLAQGTDREANGREKDLVLELCWHGPPREKGAGRGTDTGGGGAGIPLRASKLKKGAGGGVCPAFSGLGHGVVRIKIGQRRPFRLRAAGSKWRLRVMASPAFFRPMDGPLAIGVEVRLGLVIKRGEGLIQWTTQIHRRSLIRQC